MPSRLACSRPPRCPDRRGRDRELTSSIREIGDQSFRSIDHARAPGRRHQLQGEGLSDAAQKSVSGDADTSPSEVNSRPDRKRQAGQVRRFGSRAPRAIRRSQRSTASSAACRSGASGAASQSARVQIRPAPNFRAHADSHACAGSRSRRRPSFRGASVQVDKSGLCARKAVRRHDDSCFDLNRGAIDRCACSMDKRPVDRQRKYKNPRAIARGGGFHLVDPSGIEPLTSTMPLWRSPS